ncbi:unnamed protein product, partial [Meganyctiphanes norvegica]
MEYSNTKDKGITSWSYYHLGDVEIPEICVYSIENRCQYEKTGCKRLHAKCACHWQMKYDEKWINFRLFQSRELEESFQDPAKNECSITPFDTKMLEPSSRDMFKILGVEMWEANFKLMLIMNDSHSQAYTIRRLSTHSSAISNSAKSTVFEWYFVDKNNKWTKYGDTDSTGNISLTSNVTSNEIEKHFIINGKSLFKFKNADFEYELDFSKMIQRNLKTGKEREVRRRSQKRVPELQLNKKEVEGLPSHWDPMNKSDPMTHVLLTSSQKEYAEVESLLTAEVTNAHIISINRIQSPFLWRPLKNKMEELVLKYGSEQKLNMQKLFHGTKSDIVDKICKENFDWRLHGTSTGQLYGRGTYFSNSAAYSHNYSHSDSSGSRFMMVARVLVGYTVKGDSSMTRPPTNPTTGMLYDTTVDDEINPKIFVKYDKQEYYPEYIIEYTTNLQN